MKKQLLTSTALVAAGVLVTAGAAHAQKGKKPAITVNGYMEQVFGSTIDEDKRVPNRLGADQHNESEVHFNGRAVLDNGIALRAHWELEGFTSGDQIDEAYLIIRGSFGQLTLGSEDNAGNMMTTGYLGSWATGVGQNLTFDTADWIAVPPGFKYSFDGAIVDGRLRSGDNDSEKITYYTPRYWGFQVGASYIPTNSQDMNGRESVETNKYHDGFAIGANFDRKFDQIGVAVAGGYLAMRNRDNERANNRHMKAYNVAGRLDYAGFRVAASYKNNVRLTDSGATSTDTMLTGQIWEIGGRYRWGPNSVSVGFKKGEQRSLLTVNGDDEFTSMLVSYARALGPGVKWTANVFYGDFEGEDSGKADDNEGWALSTSVRMTF